MKVEEKFQPSEAGRTRQVYTVSQINRDVRLSLESKYQNIWVEGEISNFKKHSSGHIYLSVKDSQSQISAVMFNRFNNGLKFELKDGLQVLVMGKLSLYEPRGQYQFYIERIEPKGIGALQLAFQQLRERLENEGLFDQAHKRPIPAFPKIVGIVTSPTGAAIRDIINVMTRRFSGVEILLNPVLVQGPGAAEQIAQAIEEMNELGNIDILIVGRGGGSLEDLWAFNEEKVARAIYRSRIPIISAVGHEIDWTIADFVADLRAPTPSAAAELVVQNRADLEKRIRDWQYRLSNAILCFLEEKRTEFENIQGSYAFKQPLVLVQQFSQKLDELFRQLQNYLKAGMTEKNHALRTVAGRLNALSPLAILERGYSITFNGKNDHPLRDASELKVGDSLRTRLWRGIVHSKVTEIES